MLKEVIAIKLTKYNLFLRGSLIATMVEAKNSLTIKQKIISFSIATLVIIGLLVIADTEELLNALLTLERQYLLLAFLLGISSILLWSFVWQKLFEIIDIIVKFRDIVHLYLAALFMNSITPLGQFGGEPFMAYLVSKKLPVNYEKTLSTLLYADTINAAPFYTFSVIGLSYLIFTGLMSPYSTISLITIFITSLVLLSLYIGLKTKNKNILNKLKEFQILQKYNLENIILKIQETIKDIVEIYLEVKENPKRIAPAFLASHFAFFINVLILNVLLVGLGVNISLLFLFIVLPLAGIGNFSPTPGGSGTYEAAMAGLLTLGGVSFSTAVIAAILFRLVTYWPGLIIGYLATITLDRV